nr:MAG TPA: hypothetical protein [Caudoviricetes sp.]
MIKTLIIYLFFNTTVRENSSVFVALPNPAIPQ